ncbi:MAG: bifunctional glutamate N-acetyltransferase/amino-acid acetyltransferase ArgJ [Candidatus Omnitrophica bacterium]|nr:bifunctional glutamate N-acetyltransferase/amino-acid acetyltransferase ArgJ [Candidatus Omnitrophota bacterium]MCM8831828.1 bifunctional glutamate N-acetyltransferase/amino-acid acetyltransferase ArgJ [Candidatus Omnitrophota bacterium]
MRAPKGFLFSAINSGIKKEGLDLGLIFCEDFAQTIGFFTKNKNSSYSVLVSKNHIKYPTKAVLVNSGNANCFYKGNGFLNTQSLCENLAKILKVKKENILIASTGIIGKPLPFKKIKDNLKKLVAGLSPNKIDDFSSAIMTTDTFKKIEYQKIFIKNKTINILGFAKGAGMIYPNMATLLTFILTDAKINEGIFKQICKDVLEVSFNSISVDGCMSTNDTFFIISSQKIPIEDSKEISIFSEKLKITSLELAKKVVKDGEGATKFIEIEIKGAKTKKEAKLAAFSISNSNLFKCAIYGENPNWGRIIAALGQVGLSVSENKLKIFSTPLSKKEIKFIIDLGMGKCSWKVYTCDLTPKYIQINAQYS